MVRNLHDEHLDTDPETDTPHNGYAFTGIGEDIPPPEPPDDDDSYTSTGEYHGDDRDASTGEQGESESRLTPLLLTRSALRDLPDPEPLIDGVLDQATTALLYGKWGTCKTFIAIDWAASVATGRPWQGNPTQQRRVLYIAAEGAYGLKARIEAWEQGWQRSISDDDLHILPRAVNLTNHYEVAELVTLIQQNGYGLIVIDTLARCMVGADENSAKDCGEVVAALLQLRQATPDGRGCIAGVHHTGKDGKTFRGSSVFEAGADTVYAVAADGAVINLDREKRRDGPRVDSHRLKLDPVDGTGSVVIGASHDPGTGDAADTLLSHFKSHFEATGASGPTLRDSIDMPKSTYYRAVNDLVQRGELVNEGTVVRPFYRLVTK